MYFDLVKFSFFLNKVLIFFPLQVYQLIFFLISFF